MARGKREGNEVNEGCFEKTQVYFILLWLHSGGQVDTSISFCAKLHNSIQQIWS